MTAPRAIDVRLARDDELEEVLRLRWRWHSENGRGRGVESEFVSGAADWAREHRDTHLPHVAVTMDGLLVGMAWLALTPRVASVSNLDRWSGDLQSCYVVPELRSAGVGGLLVEAVLATACERGAEHVTVHASFESVRMYERHGFKASGRLLWADSAVEER